MLSLTVTTPKPPPTAALSTAFLPSFHAPPSSAAFPKSPPPQKPISALIIPPSGQKSRGEQKQNLYQPFHPPQSPLPAKFRSLDTSSQLEVLTNRLGLWFEYAPLITSLTRDGFTPATLEEITGISGVEQNCLVVGSQVRDSLIQSEIDPELLSFFDSGGAELLYEIRILSASQRASAAEFLVRNKFDSKQSNTLARAMKDFPLRRPDRGWSKFDGDSPGDCLAFNYFRLALEYEAAGDKELRRQCLEKALEFVVSEGASALLQAEMEGKTETETTAVDENVTVPIVRMQLGELAESTIVVVLPVCKAEDTGEVELAPWNSGGVGDFGVVEAERPWKRWVVLPGWQPVAALERGGVAVAFKNGHVLPWREGRNKSDPMLVIADRQRKEVTVDDNFYLVVDVENKMKIAKGVTLKEKGVGQSLGTIVMIVRPPREENDQLSDEDWD